MSLPFKFLALPIAAPTPLVITSGFGIRKHPISGETQNHQSIDVRARAGTLAQAVFPGRIVRAGVINSVCGEGVIIAHRTDPSTPRETYTTSYCHLQAGSTAGLRENARVNAGQPIGRIGSTGSSTAPHLHFTLRRIVRNADVPGRVSLEDRAIDPTPFINDIQGTSSRFGNAATNYGPSVMSQSPVSGITPFIQSLESFHPKIQYELSRRRVASETANTYMPYVKLTSLSRVLPDNLLDSAQAHCPSLGIHGENDVSFDDIYLPKDNRSKIGYAISEEGTDRVPVIVSAESATATDAQNVPMPGITQITAERSTAGPMGVRGGLLKVDLKILAYSVGQVDTLLRYFLRPATRVVLELGRKSSNPSEREVTPFNWNKKESEIKDYFGALIRDPGTQKEFIKEYIHNNYGNYEVFIAYVVNFKLKYNKNNVYEIDLTVHSVQQFEVPTKHTGVQSTCPTPTTACTAMDIQEYFDDKYSWKNNSFSQLASYFQQENLPQIDAEWSSQIISIKNTDSNTSGATSTQAGTRENEYFVTWRFFVEKMLSDKRYGIASMLGNNSSVQAISDLALLRPVAEPTSSADTGLISNQVGYHPSLRSVNPEVMIIYNPIAQQQFNQSTDKNLLQRAITVVGSGSAETEQSLQDTTIFQQLTRSSNPSPFNNVLGDGGIAGASYLTRGIWLNTKAIKDAFTSTDTISSAINKLLSMMNAASEGYWNLQLYSTDVENPGLHVIDMGLSKKPSLVNGDNLSTDKEDKVEENSNILNSISGVNLERYSSTTSADTPKYMYMFNRGTKRFGDGELGSDIIDVNVEFSMPQVIAVQAIANIGGPAQKSTLQSINIDELRKITLITDLFTDCNTSDICREDPECESNRTQDPTVEVSEEEKLKQENPNLVGSVREYADLGTAIELIEVNPSKMMKKLNLDSTNAENGRISPPAHSFNSSNLTKTLVDITLPGIGGIALFQSFVVDRVPSILERGFYVVTKIVHEFSSQNGWITKIQGRYRHRPTSTGNADPNPCGNTATTDTSAVSQPVEATPARPTAAAAGAAGTPVVGSTFRPRQTDPYLESLPNASNFVLITRLDSLENSTDEPSFGSMAARESWQRRVQSGEVARDQIRLEAVKAELRKRIRSFRQRVALLPRELRGLSERRLRTRNGGSSGTF